MLDLVFDMETNDPDDLFTLLILAGHPRVNLRAVTVIPGGADQIGLVRHMLGLFGLDIPVGARNLTPDGPKVSQWYYDVYGPIAPSHQAAPADEVLAACCDSSTTLLTGGPLKNLASAIRRTPENPSTPLRIGRWVAQGGFAGEGVVPAAKQLKKFRGLRTCATHNLGVDPKSALIALSYPEIEARYFVAKNVCHRVVYDRAMHDLFAGLKDKHQSFALVWQGMEAYLSQNPAGKKFHDPLAACCAIDPQIGSWAEVELYREGGEWGARLSPGSKTWISVDYDHAKFIQVMTEQPA